MLEMYVRSCIIILIETPLKTIILYCDIQFEWFNIWLSFIKKYKSVPIMGKILLPVTICNNESNLDWSFLFHWMAYSISINEYFAIHTDAISKKIWCWLSSALNWTDLTDFFIDWLPMLRWRSDCHCIYIIYVISKDMMPIEFGFALDWLDWLIHRLTTKCPCWDTVITHMP